VLMAIAEAPSLCTEAQSDAEKKSEGGSGECANEHFSKQGPALFNLLWVESFDPLAILYFLN